MKIAPEVAARRRQFRPTRVEADLSALLAGDREALGHLAKAAAAVDELFLRQAWAGNPAFAREVEALEGPLAEDAKAYYRIMRGPWDRLKEHEPFLGEAARPAGAGFYPEDLTKTEFEAWVEDHPGDREVFTLLYTVIRREGAGLSAVPYHEAYGELVDEAASHLKAAATAAAETGLSEYLRLRADALRSDDYFASDSAWVTIDAPLEVVIGPYETYEDTLFGFKAAHEAFLCVSLPEESARLARYMAEMAWLEGNLPIPDEHKNFRRGAPPIRVVDEVLTAGDARAGVQTAAFNLPNDERVREAVGFKNVLLRNVMAAKFDAILAPVAQRVLPAGGDGKIGFPAFFHFILFHELAHGLGPGRLNLGGRETEARLELRELYSPIEEAKADTLAVHNLMALGERGLVPQEVLEALPWTYVAGLFRTARFGTSEAHGLGVALQAGALLEFGALRFTADGRCSPLPEKFPEAFRALARELLVVQATGDCDGARRLIARWGTVAAPMARLIDGLKGVPVDIEPGYAFEETR
jgi:hypothetical protein